MSARTAILRDLAQKLHDDVARAIVQTVTLADDTDGAIALILHALLPVGECLGELLEGGRGLERKDARRLALEVLILQLDVFAGAPIELAQERRRARLGAARLGHLDAAIEIVLGFGEAET
jgi:hypothetical protein